MGYIGPPKIYCELCGYTDYYGRKNILSLKEECKKCGNSFKEIGEEKRKIDDHSNYEIGQVMLFVEIESALDLDITLENEDEFINTLKTIRDLKSFFINETKKEEKEILEIIRNAIIDLNYIIDKDLEDEVKLYDIINNKDRWNNYKYESNFEIKRSDIINRIGFYFK